MRWALALVLAVPFWAQDSAYVRTVNRLDTPGYVQGLALEGDLLFIADGDSGFRVVKNANPLDLTELGSCTVPGFAYHLFATPRYQFIAAYNKDLQVVDLNDTLHPIAITGYDFPSGLGLDVAIQDRPWEGRALAFVAAHTAGLQVLEVTDPTSLSFVGAYDTPGRAYGVFVQDTLAYVADSSAGLQILNVQDPSNPTLVATFAAAGEVYDVLVQGTLAFLAAGTGGLRILNVADPAMPFEIGSYPNIGLARALAVMGDHIVVADRDSGIVVVNVANPAVPYRVGFYHPAVGTAEDVAVRDSIMYVAEGTEGLRALAFLRPTGIRESASPAPEAAQLLHPEALQALVSGGIEVYDATGRRLQPPEALRPGVYLLRRSAGRMFKVLVLP